MAQEVTFGTDQCKEDKMIASSPSGIAIRRACQ